MDSKSFDFNRGFKIGICKANEGLWKHLETAGNNGNLVEESRLRQWGGKNHV